jgi:hypothetical protein
MVLFFNCHVWRRGATVISWVETRKMVYSAQEVPKRCVVLRLQSSKNIKMDLGLSQAAFAFHEYMREITCF